MEINIFSNCSNLIEELRTELYKNYSRNELSNFLGVSPLHFSKIINSKSNMKLEYFFKLVRLNYYTSIKQYDKEKCLTISGVSYDF